MKNREEIIIRIKKLLALTKGTNYKEEAQNALVMAQKLMLKYKIEMREVEEHEDFKTDSEFTDVTFSGKGQSWKNQLAELIAENFGCNLYYNGTARKNRFVFFGKEEDVIIARIVLEYANKVIEEEQKKVIKRKSDEALISFFIGQGVRLRGTREDMLEYIKDNYETRTLRTQLNTSLRVDYALGFINGLKEKFNEQMQEAQEWGLVLVKDPRVDEAYEELQKTFSRGLTIKHMGYSGNDEVYYQGLKEGRKFSVADKIEAEDRKEDTLMLK